MNCNNDNLRAQDSQYILAYLKGQRDERESIIELLSTTEFTSLDHMPSEAALLIRMRGER